MVSEFLGLVFYRNRDENNLIILMLLSKVKLWIFWYIDLWIVKWYKKLDVILGVLVKDLIVVIDV